MSGRPGAAELDEFGEIARLFRPLARGAAGAFDLMDDAAVVPQRPGFDLVVTKDAIVEGVHFLAGEAPELVGRRLARVNLSDLAAKGAEPFAAFLAVAWPQAWGDADRAAFAVGLGADLKEAGVSLLGGDTVATPGPFTASLTALGWVPEGRMVRRAGTRPGDRLMVSGHIGDGWLGLRAAREEIADPDGYLSGRYRLPQPRLDLRRTVLEHASAAADVSDGLIADAGHIAAASGVRLTLDLDRVPLSAPARAWLEAQADPTGALLALASGGDDYEIVATSPVALPGFVIIGEAGVGQGIEVLCGGQPVDPGPGGWRHG
ncbi:thiamine-phosphate kinase [Phenylobacterium sp.]|uniref:thiamine-phosphate kinase n=1 Tax=Phenylobacterium sp. TaxID=1871053 RepID=UPI0025D635E8|nr:thiamine-phosphate kinase [Phenylobacterium sp.]